MTDEHINGWKKVFDRIYLAIGLVVLAAFVALAIWIYATMAS